MKLKELQALLQDVKPFPRPKTDLEQYPTGPHLASRMLYTIENSFNDLDGQTVMDLGCGTGMLSIGAALLGSPYVLGLDIDPEALATAQTNCLDFEDPLPIDFALVDIPSLASAASPSLNPGPGPTAAAAAAYSLPALTRHLQADVVIMNPPFGTKRKGVDMEFLRAAFAISTGSVYSLHKSSTRQHIQRVAERELGATHCQVLAELRYDLPATMKFHKQKSVDIEVDLWRFEVPLH